MNRIYKVVWSKAKNCYVVASELAKRHTKGSGTRSLTRAAVTLGVIAGLTVGMTGSAWAAVSSDTVDSTGTSETGGAVTASSSATFIQGSADDAEAINNIVGGFTRSSGTTTVNDSTFKVGNTTIGVTAGNASIDTNTITAQHIEVVSGGELTANGVITAGQGINIGGAVTDYKITATGDATFNNLTVKGNETVSGTLGVTGKITGTSEELSGNITAGSATITGNETVGGTLTVTGKTEMNGGATVADGLTVSSGGLTVENGDTTVQNLKVNGTLDMNEIQIGSDPTKTNISAGEISASNLSPNPDLTTSGSTLDFNADGFVSTQYNDGSVSGTASGSSITQQNGTITDRTITSNGSLVSVSSLT